MPRVGSSRISSFGFGAQPAGEQHLLLVAAGELADGLLRARALDAERLDEAVDDLALWRLRSTMPCRRRCGSSASVRFSRTDSCGMMPSVLRSSGREADLVLDRVARRLEVQRRAVDADRRRSRAGPRRRWRAPSRCGRSRAGRPARRSHRGGSTARRRRSARPTAQVGRLEQRRPSARSPSSVAAPVRELLGQLAAEHLRDQLVAADLRHRALLDRCARRASRDPVADRVELVEPVARRRRPRCPRP